jgi:hypothetical protein
MLVFASVEGVCRCVAAGSAAAVDRHCLQLSWLLPAGRALTRRADIYARMRDTDCCVMVATLCSFEHNVIINLSFTTMQFPGSMLLPYSCSHYIDWLTWSDELSPFELGAIFLQCLATAREV